MRVGMRDESLFLTLAWIVVLLLIGFLLIKSPAPLTAR